VAHNLQSAPLPANEEKEFRLRAAGAQDADTKNEGNSCDAKETDWRWKQLGYTAPAGIDVVL